LVRKRGEGQGHLLQFSDRGKKKFAGDLRRVLYEEEGERKEEERKRRCYFVIMREGQRKKRMKWI